MIPHCSPNGLYFVPNFVLARSVNYFTGSVTERRVRRVVRGVYALPETWKDEMYFLQYRFSRRFSNETAHFNGI
jgi:hypothetical protein